ncbi:hypothetical protein M9H77_20242 [Catharanthus roseus]|uniref:Uncharacterized protein n=1 Tax=Catharanthus roseus TaxID=4058 RepID=A0ACC0AK13_CATRO|nr:hypothetical protein M9H77_20242 [Catharanthus roseus]
MAGSRLQANKSHKSRFSSKSSRNAHKVPLKDKHRIAKSERNVGKGARAARLQRNKMLRDQKRAELLKEKRASSGSGSPPRVIVLFGLSSSVDLDSLEKDLLRLLSSEKDNIGFPAVASSEYKLRATILKAPHGDLSTCMELAKVADLIAFVASARSFDEEGSGDDYIDSFGSHCLSVFRTLGLPSTAVLIRDAPVELKKKNDLKKCCTSSLASEFPEDCKFYLADTKDDLHKFIWLFKEQRLTVPYWRQQRPYLMAQKVDLVADDNTSGKYTLVLTGYLRARTLSVNQLVIKSLGPDPMKQEPLLVENIADPLAGEQTWPTEAEMAEADRSYKEKLKKILPPGTSEYQAAWIADDSDADYTDSDENEDDEMVLDERGNEFPGQVSKDGFEPDDDLASLPREYDDETETGSIMMEDENLTKEQIEEEIRKIKAEHADDEGTLSLIVNE